jgi:hypothetical protein
MPTLDNTEARLYSSYLNRLYAQQLRAKAAELNAALASMRDPVLQKSLTKYLEHVEALAAELESIAQCEMDSTGLANFHAAEIASKDGAAKTLRARG